MDFILFAIALLILLFSGGGVALLLLRGRQTDIVELLSLSVLYGSAFISLASFCLGFLISGLPLRLTVTSMAIIVGSLGAINIARRRSTIIWRAVASRADILFAVVILLQFLIITWVSLRLSLGYDGLIIWETKARLIFSNGGVMPASYFQDASKFFHPDYPLLLPLTESWFYGWMWRRDQGSLKLVFPLFYLSAAGMLFTGGARLSGRRWRGFLSAALLFLVPTAVMRVSAGEADFPLGVFYLASVIYLLDYWKSGEAEPVYLMGGLGAVMPWVKQEGAILWLCLVGLAVLRAVTQRRWRTLWPILLPGALLLFFWTAFLRVVNAMSTPVYLAVTFDNLRSNLSRVPVIAQYLLREMTSWRTWSLLWPGMLLALPPLLDRRKRTLTAVALAAIISPVSLYSAIYLFSAWNPFTLHIEASLSRLLLQISLVVLLLVGLSIPGDREPREDEWQEK